jgi:hypothetical protein
LTAAHRTRQLQSAAQRAHPSSELRKTIAGYGDWQHPLLIDRIVRCPQKYRLIGGAGETTGLRSVHVHAPPVATDVYVWSQQEPHLISIDNLSEGKKTTAKNARSLQLR